LLGDIRVFQLDFRGDYTAAGRVPVAGEMARKKNRNPMIFSIIGLIPPASALLGGRLTEL
jgi:hypothetical protein